MPGVDSPCTAKMPAIVMNPSATSSVGKWRTCSAARAVRTATRRVMTDTFVVMTKCSTGLAAGWFRSGVARSQPRMANGARVATKRASGRTGTRESLVVALRRDARDGGQKPLQIEGFWHHVRRTELLPVTNDVGGGGEHDDRDAPPLLHACREGPPVHHRHHEIEHHDVRREPIEKIEGVAPVARGLRLVPVIGERRDEQIAYVRIVVHDENPTSTHRGEMFA